MTTSASSSTTIVPAAQLVYAVTNVYSQFSFKLTVDGSKYKLWRRIFLDICKGAKVVGHINGNSKPTSEDDEDWESIDSHVKSWFYSTCDPNLLQIISSDKCTAKDLWDKLDEFFLNNKMSRMLQLQDQFRNTKKGASSITEYCHALKNLADALADVDYNINEVELVMQILSQLPPSYHSIVDVITHTKLFPSFLEAKNMLLLHELREDITDSTLDSSNNNNTALYSVSTQPGKAKNKRNKNRNNNRHASKGGGNSSMSTGTNSFAGILGNHPTQQPQPSAGNLSYAGMQQGWPTIPFPPVYTMQQPSQAQSTTAGPLYYPAPYAAAPTAHQAQFGQSVFLSNRPVSPDFPPQHPGHFFGGHVTASPSPQQMTDLCSAFQAMSVQPPQDNHYYMDTGASSHMWGKARPGGEFESRRDNLGGDLRGRGRGGGGELVRRNDGRSFDGRSFDASRKQEEAFMPDRKRDDGDRFVSKSGRGGKSMSRERLMASDGSDEEEMGRKNVMSKFRELISDDEDDVDDDENDYDAHDGGILEKPAVVNVPRVSPDGSESYLSEKRFDECAVSPLSLKAIKDAGYEKMTVVQEATLPVILKGKDVLAKARTGTGKTVAFLLPSIEVVVKSPAVCRDQKRPPIQVLIICPTRELASQAAMEANKLIKYHTSVGVQVVIGGTQLGLEQKRMQASPCQILVATPGRLTDHIENTAGFASRLMGVKVLVLDEADHLLDMGFRKDIEKIIAAVPKQRQTLLFSATVPPEVRQICHIALKRDHEYVNTVREGSEETHTQVQQTHLVAPLDKQFSILYALLRDHIADDTDYKVLVFCTTAKVTRLVADLLGELKLNVREIHSRKTQSYRTRVSDEFRKSKGLILVTSDVSARGVDYPDVTLVIQVGLPSDKAQYIHRLGRTGRKGKEGQGILLLAPWEQFFLSNLKDLPLSKAESPLVDPDTKKKVEKALCNVEMKNKESAYQAWLGYYNSDKTIGKNKYRLVELANEFSRSMGLDNPPAIRERVLGKMGLKNVPGLRSK